MNILKIIKYEEIIDNYLNEYGKIIPRRITKIRKKKQKQISKKIKIARFLGLISYVSKNNIEIQKEDNESTDDEGE